MKTYLAKFADKSQVEFTTDKFDEKTEAKKIAAENGITSKLVSVTEVKPKHLKGVKLRVPTQK